MNVNDFGHVSIVFEYDMMCACVYCVKCFNFSNIRIRIRTDFYIKIRTRRMQILINSVTSLEEMVNWPDWFQQNVENRWSQKQPFQASHCPAASHWQQTHTTITIITIIPLPPTPPSFLSPNSNKTMKDVCHNRMSVFFAHYTMNILYVHIQDPLNPILTLYTHWSQMSLSAGGSTL